MKNWFRDHGLLLALSALFIASICGQFITGYQSHNDELEKHKQPPLSMRAYATSGHFIEATFENWESEFLQMGLYVVLTAALYQRGSAESNPLPDELKDEPQDEEKFPKRYFKHNRLARRLYENSLSLASISGKRDRRSRSRSMLLTARRPKSDGGIKPPGQAPPPAPRARQLTSFPVTAGGAGRG